MIASSSRLPLRRFRPMVWLAVLGALAAGSVDPAGAEPQHVLRVASVAPEGSAWAREFATFVNAVDRGTNGEVQIKLYLGGVAGEEMEVADRITRGQLDGALSGGILCTKVMPSMRVARVPGIFQSRDEAIHVVGELMPTLHKEARTSGYELIGIAGIGASVIFTREPVRNLADLRKVTFWRWRDDEVGILTNREMGLHIVPDGLRTGARAYDRGDVDGFYAVPAAALVFQWYTQVGYVVDLPGDYLLGCILLDAGSLDVLSAAHQRAIREAGATLAVRFEEAGRRQDEALMSSVFQKRGVKKLPISTKFRAEFFQAARTARKQLGEKLVPKDLLDRVLRLLADYRAEHNQHP